MADSAKYSAGAMALLKANLGFYGTDAPAELVSYWGSLLEYSHDAFADMGIPLQPGTLADDMDRLGGATNAFTAKESTCFYTKVMDEHLERGISLLADLLLRPEFPQDDLEREKGVVIEEIAMCEDNPEDLVHELLSDAQYQGHSLGLPILGTEKIIRNVTREKLFAFMKKHYTPRNTVISVAGRYDWDAGQILWRMGFRRAGSARNAGSARPEQSSGAGEGYRTGTDLRGLPRL